MTTILPRSHWTSEESEAVDVSYLQTSIYLHYPAAFFNIGLESKEGIIGRLQSIRHDHLNSPEGYTDIAYNWAVDQVGRIWELRGKRQSGAMGLVNRIGTDSPYCASWKIPKPPRRNWCAQ